VWGPKAGIIRYGPIGAALGREQPLLSHPQRIVGVHILTGFQVLPQGPPGWGWDGKAPVRDPLPTSHGGEARPLPQRYIPLRLRSSQALRPLPTGTSRPDAPPAGTGAAPGVRGPWA